MEGKYPSTAMSMVIIMFHPHLLLSFIIIGIGLHIILMLNVGLKVCGRYTIIHPLYLLGTFITDIIQTYCIVFREVKELEHWFYWCCEGTIRPYLCQPAVSRYNQAQLLSHLHWISCPPVYISKTVRTSRGCIIRCGRFRTRQRMSCLSISRSITARYWIY